MIDEFEIKLKHKEWEKCTEYIIGKERKKFNRKFDDFLTKKLQNNKEFNFKCWLLTEFNWFKKIQSRKESCYFWNGKYKCIEDSCGLSLNLSIIKPPIFGNDVIVKVKKLNDPMNHIQKLIKIEKCQGLKRKFLGDRLLSNGTSNTKAENFMYNLNKNCYEEGNYT